MFCGVEAFGGVVLGSDEVVAPFSGDGLHGARFVVQGGEGDAGTGELHDGGGKQGAPFADLAVLLGTGGRDHRHGAAEGDDHAAFPARPAPARRW